MGGVTLSPRHPTLSYPWLLRSAAPSEKSRVCNHPLNSLANPFPRRLSRRRRLNGRSRKSGRVYFHLIHTTRTLPANRIKTMLQYQDLEVKLNLVVNRGTGSSRSPQRCLSPLARSRLSPPRLDARSTRVLRQQVAYRRRPFVLPFPVCQQRIHPGSFMIAPMSLPAYLRMRLSPLG